MGCEVVSVYNDEVAGVLGYPEEILEDLHHRDFMQTNLLKKVQKNHRYLAYGFTQSFTQNNLFTYVLANKQNAKKKQQFFVYASGRFLIIADMMDIGKQVQSLMHEDKIVAMDVKGKLCLIGTLGGRIVLWDLQFFQRKFDMKLPESSKNFSSLSLTNKYIFCTDTSHPKNICFCYDYRTSKLLTSATLGSYEPTLKGKGWQNNHHVTVAADGIWFSRYSHSSNEIQVTKGMFRSFPKTSMTCIEPVNQKYVITGSVDGYIFLWAHYQCQRAIKAGQQCISQFCLFQNYLIVSNFNHNVRVYSYEIIQKKLDPKNQDHQAQLKSGQITQDFVNVILDSYDRSPLQSICVSKTNNSLYFGQTRNGIMFDKMIPSPQYEGKVIASNKINRKMIDFEGATLKYIENGYIWLIGVTENYCEAKKMLLSADFQKISAPQRFILSFNNKLKPTNNKFYALLPNLSKFVYIHKNKIISYFLHPAKSQTVHQYSIQGQMQQKYKPLGLQFSNSQLQQQQQETICVFEDGIHAGQGRERLEVIGLISFIIQNVNYILILFDLEYLVVSYDQANRKWVREIDTEYNDGKIISQIQIKGEIIKIEERNNRYVLVNPQIKQQLFDKMSFIQCQPQIENIAIMDTQEKNIVSLARDSMIVTLGKSI